MRWRADLRNKRCTAEEIVQVRFDAACKRVQEEESERRVVAVIGPFVLRPGRNRTVAPVLLVSDGCVPAFRCSPVCSMPCCGCRLARLRILCSLFVGPHVARTSAAHPCVSVQVGFQRLFCSPEHPFCSNVCVSRWSPWARLLFVCTFLKSLMGSLDDGSVVTWVWVLKFLMGSLGEGSIAAFPNSLVDSTDVGSVLTWKMILVSDACGLSSLCVTKCSSGGLWFCPFSHPERWGVFFSVQARSGNCPETPRRLSSACS